MKKLFSLLFLAAAYFIQAQDTTYYNDGNKVLTLSSASSYEVKIKDTENPFRCTIKTYTKEGQLIQSVDYKKRDDNNQIMHGHYLNYWPNGKLKRNDIYENGKLEQGKCYNHQGQDTVYFFREKMPEFPGGPAVMMQYINKAIVYPKKASENGIEGKVFVKFVIETDGSISNAQILKGVNEELDAEAIRVIQNMPKWIPGVQEGKPVRVYFNLPVIFRLRR